MFLVSYLSHLVSHMLPVVCGHFPACLTVSCVWSLSVAQSTQRFRSQLGGFLEKMWALDSKLQCKHGFADFIYAEPYFCALGPCLHCPNAVEFSLWGDLYCWLTASTQNRFMFTKKTPLLPAPPSSTERGIAVENLVPAGAGCSPQTTQGLALS